tara:strand:+ start:847 stop:1065 length:219 start_codon:yes stop_codon:yes gene_type:complete
MKFLLTLVMCSGVANTCLPPFQADQKFDGLYSCLMSGYAESVAKIEEIGQEKINKNLIHIKFYCTPVEDQLT